LKIGRTIVFLQISLLQCCICYPFVWHTFCTVTCVFRYPAVREVSL
jgi:hypothetical protein